MFLWQHCNRCYKSSVVQFDIFFLENFIFYTPISYYLVEYIENKRRHACTNGYTDTCRDFLNFKMPYDVIFVKSYFTIETFLDLQMRNNVTCIKSYFTIEPS